MLDWLKNLGGKKPWRNKVGLDENAIALLAEDVGAVEKIDTELPKQLLCYLLDGTDSELVLNKLSTTPGIGDALQFNNPVRHRLSDEENSRSRFFQTVRCEKAEFFVRLGKMYAAALMLPMANLRSQLPVFANQQLQRGFEDPNLEWLNLLLTEAACFSPHSWPRTCKPCPALTAKLIESMLKLEEYPPELLIQAAFQPQLARFNEPPFEVVFRSIKDLAESAVRH